MMELKRDSTKWINQSSFIKHRFEWQEGYGTFSVSKTKLDSAINYILCIPSGNGFVDSFYFYQSVFPLEIEIMP